MKKSLQILADAIICTIFVALAMLVIVFTVRLSIEVYYYLSEEFIVRNILISAFFGTIIFRIVKLLHENRKKKNNLYDMED